MTELWKIAKPFFGLENIFINLLILLMVLNTISGSVNAMLDEKQKFSKKRLISQSFNKFITLALILGTYFYAKETVLQDFVTFLTMLALGKELLSSSIHILKIKKLTDYLQSFVGEEEQEKTPDQVPIKEEPKPKEEPKIIG